MTRDLPRRDVLRLAGVTAVAGVLAGCTKSSGTSAPTSGATSISSGPTTPPPTPTTTARPSVPTFAQLAPRISGGLVQRGHRGYDPAALLYNARFAAQARPKAIAHCRTSADVAACVRFSADGGAPLRLRNGGHSYGGWSSGPGLVADLGGLKSVTVNSGAGTATIGAGALLADVYSALAARGVSIGAGSCATVGVTGLTLGGGVGVLSRAYGLTCDQLRSVEVVTADGKIRTIDTHRDPDLYWALRGGGGSFAAATSLTFAVRPAPTVATFFLQWPWSAASSVLTAWQHWIRGLPRELWSTCKLLNDPGQGAKVTVSGTWIGSRSLDSLLGALLSMTPPPSSNVRDSSSYGPAMLGQAGCSGQSATQCIADALAPAKRQPFAATSSIMTRELPPSGVAAIVAAVNAGGRVANLIEGGVSFDTLGGTVADVSADATAFPWRTALATVQYTATWSYANAGISPTPFDAFVRGERHALAPWLGSAAYVNYADPAISDYAHAYWGPNLPRLQEVKRTYDPHNVFSFPQSVPL